MQRLLQIKKRAINNSDVYNSEITESTNWGLGVWALRIEQ